MDQAAHPMSTQGVARLHSRVESARAARSAPAPKTSGPRGPHPDHTAAPDIRGPRVNGKGNQMFFFFIGRRYPFLTLIIGAALLVVGVAIHSPITDVIGCVGILMGGFRTVSKRRRSITGGRSGGWGSR
jgi:hypothetical protein